MGKTVRGAKRATFKGKHRRRTDKHQSPPPPALDEKKLVGRPRGSVRRTR